MHLPLGLDSLGANARMLSTFTPKLIAISEAELCVSRIDTFRSELPRRTFRQSFSRPFGFEERRIELIEDGDVKSRGEPVPESRPGLDGAVEFMLFHAFGSEYRLGESPFTFICMGSWAGLVYTRAACWHCDGTGDEIFAWKKLN